MTTHFLDIFQDHLWVFIMLDVADLSCDVVLNPIANPLFRPESIKLIGQSWDPGDALGAPPRMRLLQVIICRLCFVVEVGQELIS